MKELCSMYRCGYEGLRNALIRTGVINPETRKGKGRRPNFGHMELLPFFKIYGDRTGYQSSVIGQLELFKK